MLIKLYVQNYALIRELDITPDSGLTVITGETGAGKSILLGALSLVLGSRADTAVLLDKTIKCVVEGTFRIKEYDLKDFFIANELDYDHESTIRREINPAGKSRAFINDTPVNLNILKELGEKLIDIHSQHQTLMLNENSFQLNVIDSFAGNGSQTADYKETFGNFRAIIKEYEELKERTEKNRSDLEYYSFQLKQLEEAKLLPGEAEELEREQEMLEHSGEIKLALNNSSAILLSEEASVLNMMRELKINIAKISSYLPGGENLLTRIESAYIELDDIGSEIERLSSITEADPERLNTVNSRLDILYTMMQKHRVQNVDELIAKRGELELLVKSIVTSDERLSELEASIDRERAALQAMADKISEKRIAVIPEVETRITELLKQLGMPNAKFRIDIKKLDEFSRMGKDAADFMFSANKQVAPENLSRVASGGELSRVMLSLKSLLSMNKNLPTIIFDEIDSGVSGEVADKVGQILADMGKYMQVINITHLPQVAAKGGEHYHVYKDDTNDSTITRIKLLSTDERVMEIAKLLSGSEVTSTALKNAEELLKSGKEK